MALSNFSTYLKEKLIGVSLLSSSYTAPTTVFYSLATSMASQGLALTEVPSGTAYARQVVAFGTISGFTVRNTNLLTFPTATTPWGAICYVGIYDSPTGGNLLYWGTLSSTQNITTSQIFQTPVGSLAITLPFSL